MSRDCTNTSRRCADATTTAAKTNAASATSRVGWVIFTGAVSLYGLGLRKNEEVLSGQVLVDRRQPEAFVLHFELHLLSRHLVLRQDRYCGIFRAIFEEDQPPARFQCLAKLLQ